MSENRNSISQILKVTLTLCLFCAIVVSAAAIILRPKQQENKSVERSANMLAAAGLLDMSVSGAKSKVKELMTKVTTRLVDLETGEFSSASDPEQYNQKAASKAPETSSLLPSEIDTANIKRREKLGQVFFVTENNQVDAIILPVRGYGLWSTMYGFIALENDGNTVRGLGFYEHGETPGLGGLIDDPKWKSQWSKKKILSKDGTLAISVVKNLNQSDPDVVNKVDGISGASLTSRGVNNLIRFWLGNDGYGPFLNKLRNNEVNL